MNAKGHKIDSIYMSGSFRCRSRCLVLLPPTSLLHSTHASTFPVTPHSIASYYSRLLTPRLKTGGQVKNKRLMSILSSICQVPVILPPSSSAAVVSGSAFLGRFAHEVASARQGKEITSMEEVRESGKEMGERLWEIMVSSNWLLLLTEIDSTERARVKLETLKNLFSHGLVRCFGEQVEMTPPGKRVVPEAKEKEVNLLDVKYKIFRESIDVQRSRSCFTSFIVSISLPLAFLSFSRAPSSADSSVFFVVCVSDMSGWRKMVQDVAGDEGTEE
jgi:hypothetical protein